MAKIPRRRGAITAIIREICYYIVFKPNKIAHL